MSNKQPHKAIINCQVEIHPLLQTGECDGHVVPKTDLKIAGLSEKFILTVTGFDKFECLKKLKEKIEEFNK